MADRTEIRIGTSGWYYKHSRGRFYAEEIAAIDMLSFYVGHFDTVEKSTIRFTLFPVLKLLASGAKKHRLSSCLP